MYASDSPVSQLTTGNLNHIGLKSKSTQNLGDSFVTFVSKIAAQSGILDTPMLHAKNEVKNIWEQIQPQIPFIIKSEVDKTEIPQFKKVIFLASRYDNYNNYVHVYTDGSKDPITGHTGMAFVIDNGDNTHTGSHMRLLDNLSVFTTELTAIQQALEWMKSACPGNYVIFTDSLSSLQALKSGKSIRPDLTNSITLRLSELAKLGFNVVLEWVPAHVDIPGNEAADRLAKKALLETEISPIVELGVNELYSIAKPVIYQLWQNDWDHKTRPWHYALKPTVDTMGPILNNVKNTGILTRLRVGQSANLKDTMYKLGLAKSDKCDNCNVIGDASHYLFTCGLYNEHRKVLEKTFSDIKVSFNHVTLLNPDKDNSCIVFKALLKYVSNTGIKV